MSKFLYYLFDLDGTLTQSEEGIFNCARYALSFAGMDIPEEAILRKFVGPPLKVSFMEFCGVSEEQADALVAKYRERYNTIGLYENRVYDGIMELLEGLKKQGVYIAAATAKPQYPTEKIFEKFGFDKYFDVVVGSIPENIRMDKKDIITEALRQLEEKTGIESTRENTVMIGDRFYDIEGGKSCGTSTIGVLYGYGTREELLNAGADYVVEKPEEILKIY